jgi:hypothetical protein
LRRDEAQLRMRDYSRLVAVMKKCGVPKATIGKITEELESSDTAA